MTQPDFRYVYHWNRMSRKGHTCAVGGARQDEWQPRQIRGRLHRGDQMERDPTPQNADRCERTIMKAISLWQPWASLIAACGAKPYETGSFAPPVSLIGQSMRFMLRRKSIRAPLNSPKS
jgi:hypothetical protein